MAARFVASSSPSRQSICSSPSASRCTHAPVLQRKPAPLHSANATHTGEVTKDDTRRHQIALSVGLFTFAAHLVAAVAAVVDSVAGPVRGDALRVGAREAAL